MEARRRDEEIYPKANRYDFASRTMGLLRYRPEIGWLAFGLVGVLSIPILFAGGEYFWPPLSVRVAYLFMFLVCFIRRLEDRRLCARACALVAGASVLFYARAYFYWNSLGLILDYEMPFAVLSVAIPTSIILVFRRTRYGLSNKQTAATLTK